VASSKLAQGGDGTGVDSDPRGCNLVRRDGGQGGRDVDTLDGPPSDRPVDDLGGLPFHEVGHPAQCPRGEPVGEQ